MYPLRLFILASVVLASVYCMPTVVPEVAAKAANQGLEGAKNAGTAEGGTTATKIMQNHGCKCCHHQKEDFENLKITEADPEPKKTQEIGEHEGDLAQPEDEDDLDTVAKDEDGPDDKNRVQYHGEKESVDGEGKSSV